METTATRDPNVPESFPRRVLVAVTGGSPQTVTETLYALIVEARAPFVPTELHLLTTGIGADFAVTGLLAPPARQFARFCEEFNSAIGPRGPIAFDESRIHVFRNRQGQVLDDIRSVEEVTAAADAITEFVRLMTSDPDCALHASIAGGRKTTGYYLGYAMSMFGRDQDRLSHVLVSEPFETGVEGFYFKPRKPLRLARTGKPSQTISTSRAKITLADIPFVRLRKGLPPSDLAKGQVRFSEIVAAAQKGLGPLQVVLNPQRKLIVCGGAIVELAPRQYALYASLARLRRDAPEAAAKAKAETELLRLFLDEYRKVVDGFTHDDAVKRCKWAFRDGRPDPDDLANWQEEVRQLRAKVNRRIRLATGTAAGPYMIESDRGYGDTTYYLGLAAAQIVFDSGRVAED